MRKSKLQTPKFVREFVTQWKTVPLQTLLPDVDISKEESLYSQYWYRAVAGMLLSGRVAATYESRVNKTDGLRLCKEGNFNPGWLNELSWFLVQANVISVKRNHFFPGDCFSAFDQHAFETLRPVVCQGVLSLLQAETGFKVHRPTTVWSSKMIEFLTLYAAAFSGLATRDADLAKIWLGLSQLPAEDLRAWAADIGLDLAADEIRLWPRWLDGKGVTALRSTLYGSRWAYCTPYENDHWFSLSFDAHSALGLSKPLLRQPLPSQIEVDADGLVKAGAGLPIPTLARLYCLCRPIKVRESLEFQIDKKRLSQFPADQSPAVELRELLGSHVTLSDKVEKFLGNAPRRGGQVKFIPCSGVVIPENEATEKAIRKHPRLKGYLATNAPSGLLLIKPESDPKGFIARCGELGYVVK